MKLLKILVCVMLLFIHVLIPYTNVIAKDRISGSIQDVDLFSGSALYNYDHYFDTIYGNEGALDLYDNPVDFEEIILDDDGNEIELDAFAQPKSKVSLLSYDRISPFEQVTQRIAIIDTGIAWDHPALSSIDAIYWRNMIDNNNDVRDSHGHGTQIAGLLASDGTGGAPRGMLPNAKYIILKGLNDAGEAEDFTLAQSIRQAVDMGAKVIALSLGISVHSTVLQDAVDYAYQRNVLIVAAAGNHAKHVQYPAAYPSVLSVGSVNSQGIRSVFTPSGYELDVLAQGENVTVLQQPRGTKIAHGTSMAVPLVAAFALRLYETNPTATADEIMTHIILSSKNSNNWSENMGWGEIDFFNTFTNSLAMLVGNQTNTEPARALKVPRNGIISARINSENQFRWYRVHAGYEGNLTITYRNKVNRYVKLDVFDDSLRLQSSRMLTSNMQSTSFRVTPNSTLVRISTDANNAPLNASFIFSYQISADIWEANNSQSQAKVLPIRANIESTFHVINDHDWFSVDVPATGNIRIAVENVPEHMDPTLVVTYRGQNITVDYNAAGGEEVYFAAAERGTISFSVRDYNRNFINYPYRIDISFNPSSIQRYADTTSHWARADIDKLQREYILKGYPNNRFYPDRYITRAEFASMLVSTMKLATPNSNIRTYKDVSTNYWAHTSIATAKHFGLIKGYPDNTFRPDMPITRAEISSMTYNAYKARMVTSSTNRFKDVTSSHWANIPISSLARNTILQGYGDGTFKPNHFTTRAEASAMISRIINLY
ncbi:S8 family serine peptidase [Desulfuribacillus stibiiarsenatis]|nr:S8 family serine peptidase [Desulfuribacillus stibiiarsenatis]